MTPKNYMVIGIAGGLVFSILSIFHFSTSFPIALFACGALFGKGYGVFEERNGKQ